jgi:hypothetical protein
MSMALIEAIQKKRGIRKATSDDIKILETEMFEKFENIVFIENGVPQMCYENAYAYSEEEQQYMGYMIRGTYISFIYKHSWNVLHGKAIEHSPICSSVPVIFYGKPYTGIRFPKDLDILPAV